MKLFRRRKKNLVDDLGEYVSRLHDQGWERRKNGFPVLTREEFDPLFNPKRYKVDSPDYPQMVDLFYGIYCNAYDGASLPDCLNIAKMEAVR